jgi:DNA-binding response OmpR family regulator
MPPHILVVEDDPTTLITLSRLLQHAGYQVSQAATGEMAIDLLECEALAVVVADIVLGTIDGIEVLQAARRQPYPPNVIMLTGYGTLDTAIAAVRASAFDYLLKPASREILLDSVERALKDYHDERHVQEAATVIKEVCDRRHQTRGGPTDDTALSPPFRRDREASPALRVGELVIGATRHQVSFQDRPVQLTPTEYALLRFLAETPAITRPYREIVRHTHRLEVDDAEAQLLVKQHIRNLRRKLDPRYLVNDRGTGYMLVNPNDLPGGTPWIGHRGFPKPLVGHTPPWSAHYCAQSIDTITTTF